MRKSNQERHRDVIELFDLRAVSPRSNVAPPIGCDVRKNHRRRDPEGGGANRCVCETNVTATSAASLLVSVKTSSLIRRYEGSSLWLFTFLTRSTAAEIMGVTAGVVPEVKIS